MTMPTRYHAALVIFHWLLAVLIIVMLCVGFFVLDRMPNTDPGKIAVLRVHMAVGVLILVLTIARLVVRWCTRKPAPATTGYPALDRLAPVAHYGLYLVVVLMVGTGYVTGILAGLPAIVFGGSGDPLPPSFGAYPTFAAHSRLALLLAALIILHVAAAFYHQLVRRDGLLRRMAFGQR